MCLGALVHAGVPLEYLTEQLERLGIGQEYHLRSELVHRNGQQATKVHVELVSNGHSDSHHSVGEPVVSQLHSTQTTYPRGGSNEQDPALKAHHHPSHHHSLTVEAISPAPLALGSTDSSSEVTLHPSHADSHSDPASSRHLPQIEQLILAAHLSDQVTRCSLAIFRQLAEAEGAVHGIAPEQVHFHEVGATDAIVDIVGTCIGLDWLGIDRLYCAALPVGGGTVWAAHGRLPVPPPAVLKLWEMRQVPLYSNGIDKELVTPTGAAIVTTLATQFGPPPHMILQKVGLGAGSQTLPIPNILRLWIGEAEMEESSSRQAKRKQTRGLQPQSDQHLPLPSQAQETVSVLETQIDDLNPQAIAYTMHALLAAGALDVFTQAIGMKKARTGTLLTVVCRPEQVALCETIVFRETTTLGIRRSDQPRSVLARSIEAVHTAYGQVRVKVARGTQHQIMNVQPEYEDCAQLAQQQQVPWREVHRLALQTWYNKAAQPEVHRSVSDQLTP